MQQYLPFTVLKLHDNTSARTTNKIVATVLTVYGIETMIFLPVINTRIKVATVLTVYGIETLQNLRTLM